MSDGPVGAVEGASPVERRPVTVREAHTLADCLDWESCWWQPHRLAAGLPEADQSQPLAPRDGLAVTVDAVRRAVGRLQAWLDDETASPTILGSILVPLLPVHAGLAGSDEAVGLPTDDEICAVNDVADEHGVSRDVMHIALARVHRLIAARVRAEAVERQRIAAALKAEITAEDTRYVGSTEAALGYVDGLSRALGIVAGSVPAVTPTVPTLVGIGEAAEILGVTKARVHQLAPRLPEPTQRLAMGPVWTEASIRNYAASRSIKRGPVATPAEPVKCWCLGNPTVSHRRGIDGCRYAAGGDFAGSTPAAPSVGAGTPAEQRIADAETLRDIAPADHMVGDTLCQIADRLEGSAAGPVAADDDLALWEQLASAVRTTSARVPWWATALGTLIPDLRADRAAAAAVCTRHLEQGWDGVGVGDAR